MARKLQIKRGANVDLPILSPGEFGFSTDVGVEKLHIGNGAGTKNVQIPTVGVYYGDMSELVSNGIYRVGTNTNLPEGLWYGQVLVMQGADSDTVCQIGMGYTNDAIYSRSGQRLSSGIYQWRTWKSSPLADDFVAKSGDTMTGVLNFGNTTDYLGLQKIRSVNDGLYYLGLGVGSDTTRGASASLRLTDGSNVVKGRIDAWENGELTYNAAGLGYIPISRIGTGSYTGTGATKEANAVSLTFGFKPKMLWIFSSDRGYWYSIPVFSLTSNYKSQAYFYNNNQWSYDVYAKCVDNTVSFYCGTNSVDLQANYSGAVYNYIAIG